MLFKILCIIVQGYQEKSNANEKRKIVLILLVGMVHRRENSIEILCHVCFSLFSIMLSLPILI